jgi:Na+-translocating ferredoxin:NAD+ oxidoreductase RnfE subunit
MCVARELLGSGRFGGGLIDVANGFRFTLDGTGSGIQIFPAEYGAAILNLPFGGFITLGMLIAVMQYALKKSKKKKELAARLALEEAERKEAEA